MTNYLLDLQPGLTKVLAETISGSTTHYVHGPRGLHAQESPVGAWSWPVQDGLGSVRSVVDDALGVDSVESYAPYGEPLEAGAFGSPFMFTGEMQDDSGLVYLRARYYDPGLGAFPSLDPVEDLNRYQYVNGNVVNLTDSSGMIPQAPEAVCPPTWDVVLPSAYCANGDAVCLSTVWCQQGYRTVSGETAWDEYRSSYSGQAIYDEALFGLTGKRTEWPQPPLCMEALLVITILTPWEGDEIAVGGVVLPRAARAARRALPWLIALGGAVITATGIDVDDIKTQEDEHDDNSRRMLFHYTFAENVEGILDIGLRPSIEVPGDPSSDAQWGNGQYFTDLTPNEAQQFTRAQVSTAIYSNPRKWGLTGELRDIAWIEFALPSDNIRRVAPLFNSAPARAYPERGIWLNDYSGNLASSFIVDQGIVIFQPMANGNR